MRVTHSGGATWRLLPPVYAYVGRGVAPRTLPGLAPALEASYVLAADELRRRLERDHVSIATLPP